MARNGDSLEDMYAKLVLEEDDEEGVIVPNNEIVVQQQSYVLIGRFLTERNVNFNAMQNVMAFLWRPKEGMEVHDIGGLRYSFTFFHKMDIQKVMDGGPCSFEQATLVLHKLADGEDPCTVKMQNVEMWVQAYDIPKGFISENILKSVGASVGKFVRVDSNTFDGIWKPFVRIGVAINIDKPLKRRMKIKKEGGGWSWINFKYERLGTFCFVCGVLGHSERDCGIVYRNPDKVIEKTYGVWLRAPSKNAAKLNTGEKWLRNMNDGNNPWTKKNGQGTSSTTVNGDRQELERFMEVDGVVRESHVDSGGVQIRFRDFREQRDMIMPASNQKQTTVEIGGDNMERDQIVIDSKRKRIEEKETESVEGIEEI